MNYKMNYIISSLNNYFIEASSKLNHLLSNLDDKDYLNFLSQLRDTYNFLEIIKSFIDNNIEDLKTEIDKLERLL